MARETVKQTTQDVPRAWDHVMMSASVDDDGGGCVCAVAV